MDFALAVTDIIKDYIYMKRDCNIQYTVKALSKRLTEKKGLSELKLGRMSPRCIKINQK